MFKKVQFLEFKDVLSFKMGSTKKRDCTQTPEEREDPFDLQSYSDLVIYNVQVGIDSDAGFQYYSMKMPGRSQGTLDLIGDKIKNLTLEMRTMPVFVQFPPGGKKVKIYAFAAVGSSKIFINN